MNKNIFVVRHCKAAGQHPEAKLTRQGINQALSLVSFFSNYDIDRIISSPYTRAIQSITPYGERSEEHTSELQSRENLVCRLLLEKKKKTKAERVNTRTNYRILVQ